MPHLIRPTSIEERLEPGESAAAAAVRLARAKAAAGMHAGALPLLAADTLVACEGEVLGKPDSPGAAADMLRALCGRTHEVVTGLCLEAGGRAFAGIETTRVRFAALSDAEIDWYVATGEPLDKAGGYHVDGRGSLFVEAIDGSPSNVAGLPVRLLLRLAHEAGVDLGWVGR